MKTLFKSLLYFSFAGLILTGCAKNDDFSVPPINCDEPNIAVNQTIDNLYSTIKEGKDVNLYTKDETISGIVVSSDKSGNFYQQLYIVDENTQTPVTLKVDIKGGFALYPVGSKVFMKLNGTYIQNSFGMITIGGGIYTSGTGNKYPDVVTGTKLRNSLYRSCVVKTGDDFNKYINVVTLEQLKTDKTLYGKLIRISEVQFDRAVVGKTYYDEKDPGNDAQGYTLRKMVDKKGNSLVVRTGKYSNGFKDQIASDKSGTITGIVSEYNKTLQFYPRTMEDMALDKPAFEGETEETLPQHEIKLTGVLAWLGGDFKDFNAFMGTLDEYQGVKLKDYAKEAKGQGWESTDALAIKGKPAANDFVFTVIDNKVPADAESITFLLKGKATGGKSISINLYNEDGSKYDTAFNLGIVGADDITLDKAVIDANNKYLNNYNGSINTRGRWIKVTLNLKGIKYNTSAKGKFFAFKVGTGGEYDILVDEFRVVGGKDGGTDPEVPTGDLPEAKTLSEDFEKEFTKEDRAGSYDVKELDFAIGKWAFSDGGVFSDVSDLKSSGKQSVRFRGNDKAEAFIESKFVVTGLKKVEFKFGGTKFNESTDADKEYAVELFYSIDGGKTWKSSGKKIGKKEELALVSFDITAKATDKVSIKIQNVSFTRSSKNRLRINIDDIKFIK
ncbi:DUF5689 domain-containing protein [Myroides sp. M-43]|uniref:DUF5689 domain-containing protein n=1 Tax=Myroides oncorhynchi TaxID=2893756 RepID=UPI001E625C74|nr:DUF5689 domain-containing protein [Myroides oncorhynchi]MCC9042233.1 DUF5689 domain-containing protein [Myroides oncorhynchi]